MARKNIFELLAERNDNGANILRIDKLFYDYYFVEKGSEKITLKNLVNDYCFGYWKNRGKCLDAKDFLNTLGYEEMLQDAGCSLLDFLNAIEIIYNFWYLAVNYVDAVNEHGQKFKYYRTTDDLQELMDECLEENGFEAFYYKEDEKLIIIESHPEAIAVAEIVEPDLAFEVIRYNHYLLKGDLKQKKAILLAMSYDLEPKRKKLHTINSSLEDDIFYLVNSINIRHNNSEPGKNYKKVVAEMDEEELEKWYDEIYQMMLLAYLELDHETRKPKVKALKQSINS